MHGVLPLAGFQVSVCSASPPTHPPSLPHPPLSRPPSCTCCRCLLPQVAADTNGAFTRFMGMEQAAPDAAGARSQRYAALVDDGILLKVVSWQKCRVRNEGAAQVQLGCTLVHPGAPWCSLVQRSTLCSRLGQEGLCHELLFQQPQLFDGLRCCWPRCSVRPPARLPLTSALAAAYRCLLLQCVDKSQGEALKSGADSILKELKAMH